MRFGSVCSGIEAASVAWNELGWEAAWLAEIDQRASELLADRYGATEPVFVPGKKKPSRFKRWGNRVTNWGDMTKIADLVRIGMCEAPDILCGGTPCQSFSIAGMRGGLNDARGNLALEFVRLADAIDEVRESPALIFWENVPGVYSDAGNAFGNFIAALAGDDNPIVPGERPANGKSSKFWRWDKKTCHHIPKWPHAGVAFGPVRAVAWRTLDAQYFGLAQRRKRVFVIASADPRVDPAAILFEFEGVRRDSPPSREAGQGFAAGFEVGPGGGRFTDVAPTMDTRADAGPIRNQLGVGVLHASTGDVSHCLNAGGMGRIDYETETLITHALRSEGFDASEDGTGRGTPIVPVCFSSKDNGRDATADLAPTLRSMGHADSHQNGGGQLAVAFDLAQITSATNQSRVEDGRPAPTMNGVGQIHVATQWAVRRLTPRECERLQGFPDNYTDNGQADGSRYKQLGNSWAVNVVRWLRHRIARNI